MPFLLADDAADEATRRLQEFGQQQLASLRQGAQDLGASAQDATQRLMSFGQQQLSSSIGTLQPPPNPLQQLPTPDVGAVTDRLQSFGQQALTSATQGAQQAQQGIQQLQPLKPLAPPSAPPAPQGQSLDQPQQPQPQSDQPLDKNGVIAYVQQKARDFGLDPAAVLAVANQEGLNTDPGSHWQLPGEKNISFGPPSWYGNGAGADIIAKHGDDAARWSWTPEGIDYWLGQVQGAARGLVGDDAVEAIVNKFERPREDLAAGEIAKAKQAYNQFVGGVQQGAQDLTQAATSKLSDISQFGDQQLSQAEAYAACGPAAAVRFAQLYGRNPTLREATDLAKSVGWSADQGMAGLSSEGSLFDKLGIPHRTVGADWDTLAREASSGNPVVISTPGHYFTADAYDPSTGAFHVGQSGKDLVHGSEWMTPAQMEQRMGGLQGGLAVDNPGVATPSPTSVPPSGGQQNPLQSALDTAGQAKDRGVQILDAAVSTAGDLATGGLTRRFNQNLQGLASDVTAGGTKTPLQVGGDLLDQAADTADKIAPMADEAGVPIEHQATVIFPESLDKVTNAVSGTPGGQVAAPFAAGLGGAAALGLGAKALLDNRDNFQAPFTLDDVKDRLDDLGSKLEDFRQQQAATSPIQPGGWTAPVARGLEAANDVLQQRSRDLDPAQITQDYLDAIRSGDVGGILNAAARGADVASGPAGTSLADVSSPLSAGLTAAGVDPNVSRVLGQAGNLIGPAALEGVIGRGLPAVAGGLATGESGALKLGATSAMDRATAAAGNLRQAVTGPVAQQLEQDLKGRVTAQELADARQTLQGVEGGSSALNPYPGAQTPQGLALLRRQLLSLAKQGALQKDWYDVSSRQIMDAAQGNKQDAEKIAQLAGIYSNNTPVDKNLDDALTAWHQWKAGEPINAPNMGGPNQRARDLLERGVPWEGRKTNNFYRNLMMHIDPDVFTALGKESVDGVKQTGVTIDVWMQRALNSLRKSPSTQAQYDWAADEIRRVADQLGWRPDQAQAAIWSAAKAGWEDEKYGTDLSRAGWSYADALRKRLTNPVGNLDEQLEAALKDPATGTDELARAFGLLGGNGEVSIPQAQQSRTIDGKTIKFPENVGKVQPQARTLINAYTAARALLTKAPQLGWARLFPMGKVADANAMKATSPDGRWSPEAVAEMQGHLNDLLGADSGVHVIPSQDGAWVLNRGTTPNTAFHNAVVTASNKLQSIDDVTLSRQAHDGEILSNDWNSNPNGEDYLAAIRQSGSERASEFQRAAERLQPAVDDVLGRTAGGAGAAEEANAPGSRLGDFLANEDGSLNLDRLGRVLQAARVGSLAGGLPTLAHIALNTPVQIGTKLASDLAANVRYPEATAAELYGAMQGLRAWGLNAASTLNQPGPLARSMGATSTLSAPGALETGLTGAVKLHPVLQDIPRQMANYMELYRTAAQQATDAGLARGGAAWRAEVARLVASPTAAMQSAANFAAGTAGLSGRMGTTGTAISQLIHDAPLARFALPIFDIGYKIASKGVEMTPTLGPLGTAWDVARGLTGTGPYAGGNWAGRGANEAVTPLAERVRNHLIGLALMYEGYQQAAQGNVTGEGPEDPAEQAALRQTGWQPSSVRLGGRYFDAHLLGQLGWPLIAGANLYEARNGPGGQGLPLKKTPTGEEQPGVLDELGDYVARQGRYFNDETFLRGVGDILNLMGAGFQQGQVPQQEAASVLQSIVPQGALLANYAASQDPFQRNPRAGANPLEDIQNALLARLPGQREQLQPRLSATGRQLSNPQQGLGILMPRSSVVQGDPILDELAKVGVKPTNVPGTLSFGSANEVKLTPQEQFRWQQYRGQALTDAATKLMSSSAYRKLDDGTDKGKIAQRNAVAAVVSSSAQVADGKLRQELAKDTSALRSRFIATGPLAPAYGYGTGGYTPLSQPLSEQTGQ